MAHRIREGMRELHPEGSSPLGGANKVVELDESYVGGKARNRKGHVPPKEAVIALVVELHEVVVWQAETGDGGVAGEAGVGSMPVVVVQPRGQGGGPCGGGRIGRGVAPLAQRGLDEALGLAVIRHDDGGAR